jgi:heme exporter protein C
MKRDFRLGEALIVLSAVMMVVALYLVFLYAPREATMGDVQRIFYFHVSSAWVGFFAFFVTFVAGIAYLRSRDSRWDSLGLSSAEVGITFTTIAVLTGSVWAKPTWNAWFPWQQEPRLLLISILLLIYLAYLMLRTFVEDREQRARFAAVYGMVAFLSVPLTFMSIRWWQRLHPVIFDRQSAGLSPSMLTTFIFCLATFTVLYLALLMQRQSLAQLLDQVEALREKLEG